MDQTCKINQHATKIFLASFSVVHKGVVGEGHAVGAEERDGFRDIDFKAVVSDDVGTPEFVFSVLPSRAEDGALRALVEETGVL